MMYINCVLTLAVHNIIYVLGPEKRCIIGILYIYIYYGGKDCTGGGGVAAQTAIIAQDTRDSRIGRQERRRRVTFADRLLAGERESISPGLTHRVVVYHRNFFPVPILTGLNFKRT